ncbi:MAG: Sua5 family C-terminal domain-containing protein, partial [Ignisphaera sp.]
PGAMPIERITETLGIEVVVTDISRGYREAEKAVAPGMKYRHYAPSTPLIVIETQRPRDVLEVALDLRREGKRVAVIVCKENAELYQEAVDRVITVGSRENLFEVAKNLFTTLRELDRLGVDIAIAESFPEKGIGLAIMNRLRKAAIKIAK